VHKHVADAADLKEVKKHSAQLVLCQSRPMVLQKSITSDAMLPKPKISLEVMGSMLNNVQSMLYNVQSMLYICKNRQH